MRVRERVRVRGGSEGVGRALGGAAVPKPVIGQGRGFQRRPTEHPANIRFGNKLYSTLARIVFRSSAITLCLFLQQAIIHLTLVPVLDRYSDVNCILQ